MDGSPKTMAQQVADTITTLQIQRTGHAPKAVTVVLSNDTLVVTLHEALSPAEIVLSQTAAGAEQVQHYHRKLFETSVDILSAEIKRITGIAVCETGVEVETTTGAVVHAFTSGVMVQVFRLNGSVPAEIWNGEES